MRRTARAKDGPSSAVTTKAPGPPISCPANSASRLPARGRPEQLPRQRIASPLITTSAPSTTSRAAAMLGPLPFQAESAERSITRRPPSNPLPSISARPLSSAAPIAFEP